MPPSRFGRLTTAPTLELRPPATSHSADPTASSAKRFPRSRTPVTAAPTKWDCGSLPQWMASSPASASTRAPQTPERIRAHSGAPPASAWPPPHSANETASGWQSTLFSQPVAVAAGQKYTVSYWAPRGHYATKDFQWASFGSTAAPLTVAGGFGAEPAGVYSTSQSFPTTSFNGGNYFADAIFSTVDNSPMTVSGHSPIPSSSSVAVSTKVSAVFSKPVTAASVQLTLRSAAGPVAGTTTYDAATRRATFTPTSQLAFSTQYTATLAGTDTVGGQVTSGGTWTFTTACHGAGSRFLPLQSLRRQRDARDCRDP